MPNVNALSDLLGTQVVELCLEAKLLTIETEKQIARTDPGTLGSASLVDLEHSHTAVLAAEADTEVASLTGDLLLTEAFELALQALLHVLDPDDLRLGGPL